MNEAGDSLQNRHAMLEETEWAAKFTGEGLKPFANDLYLFTLGKIISPRLRATQGLMIDLI